MLRIFNHYVHRATIHSILGDVALAFAIIAAAALLVLRGSFDLVIPAAGTHVLSLAACLFAINSASGLYEKGSAGSVSRSAARAAVALAAALPLTWFVFELLPDGLLQRESLQLAALAGVAAVVMRRVWLAHGSAAAATRTRILVFGAGAAARVVGSTLQAADPDAHIVGYVAGPNEREPAVPAELLLEMPGTLPELAHALQVDEIVVALTERRSGSMPLRQLLDCKLVGVSVHDLNTHFEKRLGQIRVDYLNAGWLIFGDGFNQGAGRTFIKRVFDIVFASLLFLLALPIMAVTALLIRFESAGPVLYRQERVGLSGSSFQVIKFRSMRTDAEKDGKPRWASNNDDRVTRVGHVIRRLRIDELPQLINVLKGEMSLVGPRPERPFFVEQLTQEIPFFAVRHSVKPGVTGWAQVRYQYGATVEDSQEKLQYDLYYVKNHTLFLDLVVLFETVGVVLTGKGAR